MGISGITILLSSVQRVLRHPATFRGKTTKSIRRITMSANTMYALSIEEIANAIAIQVPLPPEDKTTIIVEGEMGSGKSSILKVLDEDLPDHKAIYFDCTTPDVAKVQGFGRQRLC
jgi:Tfp pilus assembly ATPase PilU